MHELPKLALSCLIAAGTVAAPTKAHSQDCMPPSALDGGPTNAHTQFVETQLHPPVIQPGAKPFTLHDRMRIYGVTGISVAVIHDGRIDWARGWGFRDAASCAPVTPDTAFQAASISKAVTAMIALRMVEQGKIELDGDINAALRSWQLPRDESLAPDGVSLRQLLSHTAGLGVHGFVGYLPGSPLPTPVQILDGTLPSNTPAVRSILPAGGQWRYSGGGYVLAQLALADVTESSFVELAERELLGPLGMTCSSFDQPSSNALGADFAFGHANGRPIPGNYLVQPELAPAGLWTTPTDLARLILDVQASAAGQTGHRLSPKMTNEMLTPTKDNWGLGPALHLHGAKRFGHDGLNEGYQSFMIAYVDRGEGVVVLTSGGSGRKLIDEVVRAVATDYGWSDIAAPATQEVSIAESDLALAAGYFAGADLRVMLEAKPEGLFAHLGGPSPERLQVLSRTRFRSETMGVIIEFNDDYSSFDIVEGGPPIKLMRRATE